MPKAATLPTVRRRGESRDPFKDVAKTRVSRGPMKGTYRLPTYPRAGDYRDTSRDDQGIWSIGRALHDMPGAPKGSYFASLDSRFYSAGKSKDWECVWLR